MGNTCKNDTPPPVNNTNRISEKRKTSYHNLLLTNREFTQKVSNTDFKEFHKNIIENDIIHCQKFLREKDWQFQSSQIQETNIHKIYKIIVSDLQNNQQHLYNQIITHYKQFVTALLNFEESPTIIKQISYDQFDIRTSIQFGRMSNIKRSQSVHQKSNINIQQQYQQQQQQQQQQPPNKSKEYKQIKIKQIVSENKLAQLLLDQLALIFKLCFIVLDYVYGEYLNETLKNQQNKDINKEFILYKVYQKEILYSNNLIQNVINYSLLEYYDKKADILNADTLPSPNLTPNLLPNHSNSILSEGLELYDSTEKLDYISSGTLINYSKIPYASTFPMVEKIIHAKMPWFKFRLIGDLDNLIESVFIKYCSETMIEQKQEIIQGEQAKLEVLSYILQKYMYLHKNEDLLFCYYQLKWMFEYDEVISGNLKNYFCPYFFRFLGTYELAYKTYIMKQQQQSIHQFNN